MGNLFSQQKMEKKYCIVILEYTHFVNFDKGEMKTISIVLLLLLPVLLHI